MTLEEAQSLGPGDIIKLSDSLVERVIEKCWVENSNLCWNQIGNNNYISKGHGWSYQGLTLVKKVYFGIHNDYSIF